MKDDNKKPVKEESPATSIGNVSIEQIPITDRRYNPKKPPVLLKRFRKYLEKSDV